jgi:LacI family transcriptional regulator
MARPATQDDVASLAGVSRSTVSIVLNNRTKRRITISEETRQKVWDAAAQLGYEPNALARSLRSGQSYSIGVLVPDLFNHHYLEILEGIEQELTSQGYHLTLVVTNFDPDRERSCFRSLFQQRLDGLVLMPTFLDQMPDEVATLAELGRPAVILMHGEGDNNQVTSDIRGGAEALMDHLLSLGHRRIGFVNGVARPVMTEDRQTVYLEKLGAAGIPVDPDLLVRCGTTMTHGYEAAIQLLSLETPPTAIWTINDVLAVGARRAIDDMGLRVPEDVALAGCDGTALAAQMTPALTTIEIPARLMGQRSARVVLDRIRNGGGEPVREVLPTRLLVRRSTDPAVPKAVDRAGRPAENARSGEPWVRPEHQGKEVGAPGPLGEPAEEALQR